MSRISRMLIGAAIGAVAATAVNIISNGVGSSLNWSAQLVGYAAYAAPWLLIGAAIGYFGRFSAPKTNDKATEAYSPAVSRPANFKTMRVIKIIFGVLCLGIGGGVSRRRLRHSPPSSFTLFLKLERRDDRHIRRDVFGWQLFAPAPLQATDRATVGVLKDGGGREREA